METDYNKQATDFLQATGTTLAIVEDQDQTPPLWASNEKDAHKHIKYACQLSNSKHSYTFSFWGSIADYEKVENTKEIFFNVLSNKSKEQLKEYLKQYEIVLDNSLLKMYGYTYVMQRDVDAVKNAVLQAIRDKVKPTAYDILASMTPVYEDNFRDWCDSYGYDSDSIKAEKTYKACLEQDNSLRRLFTHEELEKLSEIQ